MTCVTECRISTDLDAGLHLIGAKAYETRMRALPVQCAARTIVCTTHRESGRPDDMRAVSLSILLLFISNLFMTFAWYAHLKELSHKPWIVIG